MEGKKRLTERRETPLTMSMWGGSIKDLKVYNRLAEYEDDEESGKIVRLPCKVGDTVYCLNLWGEYGFIHGNIFTAKAVAFYFSRNNDLEIRVQSDIHKQNYYLKYGDVCFITREEAEKRLKELQDE